MKKKSKITWENYLYVFLSFGDVKMLLISDKDPVWENNYSTSKIGGRIT